LKEHGMNISQAAKALNISRQSLQYRLKKYQVK
jgi:arginine utilization regulatory protein